jgi:hypothetical protein
MKSLISTGIALTLALSSVGGAFAMEAMSTDAMMKKDDAMMMKDEGAMMKKDDTMMMKDDTMMMKKTVVVKYVGPMTPAKVAAKYGYVWSRDRAQLATAAGITGYRGTVRQNLAIVAYLKKSNTMMKDAMMKDAMMKKDDAMMMKDEGAMMKKDEGAMMQK